MSETAPSELIVFLVDDDPSVRASVKELLESVGLKVIPYGGCVSRERDTGFAKLHGAGRALA